MGRSNGSQKGRGQCKGEAKKQRVDVKCMGKQGRRGQKGAEYKGQKQVRRMGKGKGCWCKQGWAEREEQGGLMREEQKGGAW